MNTTAIITQLSGLLNSNSATASRIAQQAIDITHQFAAGAMSQAEYQELIGDLKTEQLIMIEATEIVLKQQLYTVLSAVLSSGIIQVG